MKKVYGYIRVSTVKQGKGVSLQEQKEAIIRYAEKNSLDIVRWFEEKETAAKQGRTMFTQMMKLLNKGVVKGVVIHKIDRSARNLKDWAALGDLIDIGIEVHFAHESLDMDTRGGRLAADIQAVIASDYIRNLRDETKKGLYGRLKQGVYPFRAPIGYVNTGSGNAKIIDIVMGPIVKKGFSTYGEGKISLEALTKALKEYGLRNSVGGTLSMTSVARILRNPFYAGVMKVKGRTYSGNHEALVSADLFQRVQDVMDGKTNSKVVKHNYLYRRLVKCNSCSYSLIAEIQKGRIYYRCHSRTCPVKSLRADVIDSEVGRILNQIKLSQVESTILEDLLLEASKDWNSNIDKLDASSKLQLKNVSERLERLTDAYISGAIQIDQFETRKQKLLIDTKELQVSNKRIYSSREAIFRKAGEYLELVKDSLNMYLSVTKEIKREMLEIITSNFSLMENKLVIAMNTPFKEIAELHNSSSCDLNRDTPRTCTAEVACRCNKESRDVDNSELRARMKILLDIILTHAQLQVNEEDEEE